MLPGPGQDLFLEGLGAEPIGQVSTEETAVWGPEAWPPPDLQGGHWGQSWPVGRLLPTPLPARLWGPLIWEGEGFQGPA